LGELHEGQYDGNVGSILAHLQQVEQGAEKYIWLMAEHRLGDQGYVTQRGNTGCFDVKVVNDRSEDSRIAKFDLVCN
jgi:hypothetical protein